MHGRENLNVNQVSRDEFMHKQPMGNGLLACSLLLFFVVTKLAHAYYRMGGHAFKKTSGQFDCIFVQGLTKETFIQVGENPFAV